MGFQNPPTDLYTRPFYLRATRNFQGGKDLCLGSMNIAQYQFKYIRDVFDTFPEKLKFLMSYNGKQSSMVVTEDYCRLKSVQRKVGPTMLAQQCCAMLDKNLSSNRGQNLLIKFTDMYNFGSIRMN